MSDLIERQAAIDLIKNDAFWVQYAWGGRGHKPEMEMVDDLVESIIKQMKESVVSRLEQMPSAQPEQRWIPCSEGLPRQGQEVICQCRANMIKVLKLDACGDWYQDAEHCYMSGFVIAWMPLPDPYRAERRTG